MEKIKIAVSACLLGQRVRHDQSHRHDSYLTQTLGQFCELIPICPEVEAGLGLPREPMHLEMIEGQVRLIGSQTCNDLTAKLELFTKRRIKALKSELIFGYIFKKRSPSCGLSGIAVIEGDSKKLATMDAGIYAKHFMEQLPQIPVIDDGRLHNPELREAFFEKVFIYHHWQKIAESKKMKDLVQFHTWHKMTLMAHSPSLMREMGKVVANGKGSIQRAFEDYFELLAKNLDHKKTTKKNIDVMMHLIGHFKKELESDEKAEFLELIEHYRRSDIPLLVPITLLKHFARKYQNSYVGEQHYLAPHPLELRLRNLL